VDPAIVAALVAVPSALVAAAAAYAAGRRQAKGAHAGAVDAVRRPHQREAYLRLSDEARTYLTKARRDTVYGELLWGGLNFFDSAITTDALNQLLREHRRRMVPLAPVERAQTLVAMEGAREVVQSSRDLLSALKAVETKVDRDGIGVGTRLLDLNEWLEGDQDVMEQAQQALAGFEDAVNKNLNRLL
jgi:hypothetical protein